jgi:peptide/nickel transport system substrate-binding protein
MGVLRCKHLHPPFDDVRARAALLPAISQADCMAAIVGPDPGLSRDGVGVFPPGTPLATDVGLEPLAGPRDPALARAMLREAGRAGARMRLLSSAEGGLAAMSQVAGDMFRRLGLDLDLAVSDVATWLRRRTSQEPLERGGWSAFCTILPAFELIDPTSHAPLRGNGTATWPGWPTIPELEALRETWLDAADPVAGREIAAVMQRVAMRELPFVPLGAYWQDTALRRDLEGRVPGIPVFWGLRRA